MSQYQALQSLVLLSLNVFIFYFFIIVISVISKFDLLFDIHIESLQISKEHGGIMRFIQVSCLGASPSSSSRMLRCKAAAEEAVLRELPEVCLVSHSLGQ